MYDINGLALTEKIIEFQCGCNKQRRRRNIQMVRWSESTGLVDKYFETKPRTNIKSADYCGLEYFCATIEEETRKQLSKCSIAILLLY